MNFKGHAIPKIGHILSRIESYAGDVSKEYHISKARLYIDYIVSFITTGCGVIEYFLYQFYLKNRYGKRHFFTIRQRISYDHAHNKPDALNIVIDKEKSLEFFSDIMRRDWCGRKYHNTPEEYEVFARKHSRAIVKPLSAFGGEGVRIVDIKSNGDALYELCQRENLIVEQLIEQHKDISAIYPHSINTLRIVTVKCKCVGAAIRIGSGGGVVDNAHAGGMFAEVDIETGIVVSKAIRHNRESYIRHPDTDTVILGREMPLWKECVDLVEKAAARLPGVSLIGWDIAVTPDGPIVVELNNMPEPELIQAPSGHGIKEFIEM